MPVSCRTTRLLFTIDAWHETTRKGAKPGHLYVTLWEADRIVATWPLAPVKGSLAHQERLIAWAAEAICDVMAGVTADWPPALDAPSDPSLEPAF